MNTLTAFAQSSGTTEWSPVVVMVMMGALALVLGLAKLLRRVLGMLTRVLLSAGAAMTGIATMLAMCTVLTTVLLVYVR
ncbi:hypothetical protein F4560_007781 [Saccharothrix ecbatanensis]|jgi:hypothetical protein|uniref:Uncharacterized protein n=1 Tax=Saccharothrix ecbatanensis TaxID=1105145 RepID=A0A7W9HU45_9PSEU|nr:hypothetical protein [Saccharothrix ecbatanensis]MBB5808013.1 hypothetical protein [Saccharothrix ecbatanensis]